jgi:hypothetical protein
MCNNTDIQRRVAIERAKAKFLNGASLDHVLGEAWNAGFCEGAPDIHAEPVGRDFDAQVEEMNRELEAGL